MNIPEAIIRNFLTIGEAKLNLSNRGLVLVQGENRDDMSAKSNGAGKSSVADAICWALFGKTARGVSGDAVINLDAKKNCEVKLKIDVGGTLYYVSRGRKHHRLKNRLHIEKCADDGSLVTLTLGTDKLTQDLLERTIGCNYEVFSTAVYAGQDSMPDLPSMTDKELKELIEEAAGIKRLQRAHEIAKDQLRAAEGVLSTAERKVESERVKQTHIDAMMQAEKTHSENFEVSKTSRADHLEASIRAEVESVKGDAKLIDPEAIAAKQKSIDELQGRLDIVSGEQTTLSGLTAAVSSAQSEVAREDANVRNATRQVMSAEASLKRVDSRVGSPCGECGKAYEESDLEVARKLAEDALTVASVDLAQLQGALAASQTHLDVVSKQRSEFSDGMTDVTAVVASQRVLERELSDLRVFEAGIAARKKRLRENADRLKEIRAEVNPHDAAYRMYADQVDAANEAVDAAISRQKIEENAVSLYKEAVNVYGPSGVRAHILDSVTPFLNDRTAHYLGTLSDGNISAVWSTIGLTAKGEAREKFNIEVRNVTGAASFEGMSGGEKRKVRLATAMALQDLVASRATQPISLFMADEIDDALDDVGLERLMGILDEKAKQRGTVLVISHNELSDWIRDTATVIKEGGYARIEGALA